MMKSRRSLKTLARAGLSLFIIPILILGCSSSTAPTYRIENVAKAIQDICRDEYKTDLKARLVGSTLWIYMPVENLIVISDKPKKDKVVMEKFAIEDNRVGFKDNSLELEYLIKTAPEKERFQPFEYTYNKEVSEKINNVWRALRRVIFSMENLKKGGPQFFCLVVADIKYGAEIRQLFYYLDFKKVSYEFISWNEYLHRTISIVEKDTSPDQIKGDKDGLYIDYRDISMEEFIALQIKHRIELKFQKPEVDKNADIDKEILKIITYVIKTYNIRDFTDVELVNLFTQNRIILNRAAIWARPID